MSSRLPLCTRLRLAPLTLALASAIAACRSPSPSAPPPGDIEVRQGALVTPTFIQDAFAVPPTPTSPVTVAFSAAQTAGDLNVVVVGWSNSTSSVTSVTDTSQNTYALAIGPTRDSAIGGVESQSIYYAPNIVGAAAGSNTVKVIFDSAPPFPDVRVVEYRGLDKFNPVDVTVANTGTNSSMSVGPVTTTFRTDLLVAANTVETATASAGSNFTSRVITTDGDIVEDRVRTSAGSNSATATLQSGGHWVMQMVALRALDNSAPTAPSGLAATVVSATQINLSWTASTDDIGVTGYSVESCQGTSCSSFAQIGTPTTTTFSSAGLAPSTSYSFRVRAHDAALNYSAYSNTASGTTQSCTSNGQCASGFCVSGVCCNSACNGGCGTCNKAGQVGTCVAVASGTSCRAAVDVCDVAETCDGTSTACPADAKQPSGTVCRPATDVCDVAETCDGTSAACPADAKKPSDTVCRPAADVCDVAETCNGTASTCPTDAFLPSTTVCRPAVGVCDVAETCTGTSAACPNDSLVANGTGCDDGNACTQSTNCQAGVCKNAQALACTGSGATNTVSVGSGGGSVTLEGVTAQFPAGVFTTATNVTITSTTDTPPAGMTAYSPIYRFDPDGTLFSAPVTVTFVVGTALTNPVLVWSHAGGGWDEIAGTYAGGLFSANVTHFSEGFVASGQCVGQNDGFNCTDGNACTTNDTCKGGLCTPGTGTLNHSDNNVCTNDSCDPKTGAVHVPVADGATCDDGHICTLNDSCKAGVCTGDPNPACVAPPALTQSEINAAKQAGLFPTSYLTPTLFQPMGAAPYDPTDPQSSTEAYGINNAGTVVGWSQGGEADFPQGEMTYPYIADGMGQRTMNQLWSAGPTYPLCINDSGWIAGYGGPMPQDNATNNPGDWWRPVIYTPDGTPQSPPLPVPIYNSGKQVRFQVSSLDNVIGSAGLPTMVGTSIYQTGGTLDVWHLDNSAADSVGPHSLAGLPANPDWIPAGHLGAALHMDGSVCLSTPVAANTQPYLSAGITMMAWVNPDTGMCPGGQRTIVARTTDFQMGLGCNADGTANLTGFVGVGSLWTLPPAGSIKPGQWAHVAISWDYHKLRAYIDGTLVGEVTAAQGSASYPQTVSVGCTSGAPATNFIGALDEVAAFDIPMGADQINLYRSGTTNYRPSKVYHQWARYKDGFYDIVLAPSDPIYSGYGYAYAANDHGTMVGYESLADGTPTAALYDPAVGWTNLNAVIPPDINWDLQAATAIDSNGVFVIGYGLYYGMRAAFRLDLLTGEIINLGNVPFEYSYPDQQNYIVPKAINTHGHIVGALMDSGNFWPEQAFIYTDDSGLLPLDEFIDPETGWHLRDARAINDSDQIVGVAWNNDNTRRAFTMKVNVTQVITDALSAQIVPQLAGVARDGTGQLKAVFTYHSSASSNVSVPYGPDNSLSDENGFLVSPIELPPQWFPPGSEGPPFVASLLGTRLTWSVGGNAATATPSDHQLQTTTSPTGTVLAVLPDGSTIALQDDSPDALANAILATGLATPASIVAAGRTDGQFRVTDDGAATYRIPLWVPDGRAGVQPSLALSYSSQAGDSYAGYGWKVEGLSQITRCHRDYARDGQSQMQGIKFADSDALCLEGERLVPVPPGTSGEAGTEYRTEHNKFTKIVQVGYEPGRGPTGFLVYLPDGTRLSYGYDGTTAMAGYRGDPTALLEGNRARVVADDTIPSDGSRPPDPTVTYDVPVRYSWALASSRDRFNNEVRYTYLSDPQDATNPAIDFRPNQITYTYDAAGENATRCVVFGYSDANSPRLDVRDSFVGGLPLQIGHLLKTITMQYGSSPCQAGAPIARRYSMTYRDTGDTGPNAVSTARRAALQTVQECEGAGVCKPATQFLWTDPGVSFERIPTGLTDVYQSGAGQLIPADVTGDGLDDLIFVKFDPVSGANTWYYLPSNGSGFGQEVAINYTPQGTQLDDFGFSRQGGKVVDLDMDGKVDFLYPTSGTLSHYELLRSTGNNFVPFDAPVDYESQDLTSDFARLVLYAGDFTGDGLPDLARAAADCSSGTCVPPNPLNPAWGFRSTTPGFGPYGFLQSGGLFLDAAEVWNSYVVDTDGDGKMELLMRDATQDGFGDHAIGSRMFAVGVQPSGPASNNASFVRTSLLGSDRTGTAVRYQFVDVNGDGLMDAVEIPNSGGVVIRVAINDGLDFLPPRAFPLETAATVGQSITNVALYGTAPGLGGIDPGIRAMDYDLDGRADLFLMDSGCRDSATSVRSHPTALVWESAVVRKTQAYAAAPIGQRAGTYVDVATCLPSTYSQVMDINGDGLSDFVQIENNELVIYKRVGPKADLLKNVTDGFGHTIDITYSPISDPSVHTPETCSYPQYCNNRGTWVVAKHVQDLGTPQAFGYVHSYTGARTDISGIGWLGMDEHKIVLDNGNVETIDYDHVSRFGTQFYPQSSKPTSRHWSALISEERSQFINRNWTYTYDVATSSDNKYAAATPATVTFNESETTGSSTCVTNSWTLTTHYDPNFGYLRKKTFDGIDHREWNPQFYDDNVSLWLVGLVYREVQTQSTFAQFDTDTPQTMTRTVQYGRDVATGAVTSIIVEPDSPAVAINLRTTLGLNAAGQVHTRTETALDGLTRTATIDYDEAGGIYPRRITNALGQATSIVYHPGLGVLVRTEDPNQLQTVLQYDGFGRLRTAQSPDGSIVSLAYRADDDRGLPYVVDTAAQGGLETMEYNRRGEESLLLDRDEFGGFNLVRIDHDALGQLSGRWRPFPQSQEAQELTLPKTTYLYDNAGRPISEVDPIGAKSWTYQCNVATRQVLTDTGTQQDESEIDMLGRVVTRTEHVTTRGQSAPHDLLTRYYYGPFDVLRRVVDTFGNATTIAYDVRGQRQEIQDPDLGTETDTYNAFGEPQTQTEGNGHTVALFYDPLGRLQTEGTTEGTTIFVWDTADHGIGRLGSALSQDSVLDEYTYDPQGRRSSVKTTVAGTSYQLDYGYDSLGRPQTITYPQVNATRYAVRLDYTAQSGELQDVKDQAGTTLWSVTNRNSDRNITAEQFGDGLLSQRGYDDPRGLLTSITSTAQPSNTSVQNLGYHYDTRGYIDRRTSYVDETETFAHDELGRLTSWNGATWVVSYLYDDIGNMTRREEDAIGQISDVRTFAPAPSGFRPHAVASVNLNGTVESYGYDLAGRQTSGPDRIVTYTDFDLPRTITKSGALSSFQYDANRRRALKQTTSGSTVYVGGLYEKRTNTSGTLHIMYVPGERGFVAQVEQADGGSPSVTYLHDDHIGSIDAVSGGGASTQVKFDPFGSRVGPTPPPMSVPSPVPSVTKGFAGHEQEDDLGLINMGGRIYDPTLARFLTPDPHIARPWESQSLNRYAYAANSPLRFADPTGFDLEDDLRASDEGDHDHEYKGTSTSNDTQPQAAAAPSTLQANPAVVAALPGGPIPVNYITMHDSNGNTTASMPVPCDTTCNDPVTVTVTASSSASAGPAKSADDQSGQSGGAPGPVDPSAAGPGNSDGDSPVPTTDVGPQPSTSGLPLPPGANPQMGHVAANAVGVVVRLLRKGGDRIGRKLFHKAEAIAARRAGKDVVMTSRQGAHEVQKALSKGQPIIEHRGHVLKDGSVGRPHFQTNGVAGHTFWGSIAGFIISFFDPVDNIEASIGGDMMSDEDDPAYQQYVNELDQIETPTSGCGSVQSCE